MDIYEKYIGQVFDNRYRIDALIGVGGMAVVYKAVDLLMRRIVAVKILKDEIAADSAAVKRFINESKAVAMLSHPNIVNIYDVSVRDNVKYIVMEYIEGITLKNYMNRREVLSLKETIGYSMQILRALEHAHKKGIVHRDIKPQNIMLLRDGVIKVMDFGIAKLPNAETVTMTDKAIGTVYYISPEQASGDEIDSRCDLYSLGVLMYEMATGRLPFDADSPVSVALMQVNDAAELPRSINPKIPQGLEQIIMRAMEKDPALRYQNAEQMLDCLEKLKENPAVVFKPKTSEKIKKFFATKLPFGRMSRSMLPIVLGVFTPFFIVFCISGVYIFSHVFNNSSIKDYETIDVENFVGATYTKELEDWFKNSQYFKLSEIEYKYTDTVPEGEIMSQYPSADESKKVLAGKQFCNVKLIVSGGEQNVKLDDYSLVDYRLAISKLHANKIKCTVTNQASNIYEQGVVIKTVPRSGSLVKAGDTVEIVVSRGSAGADRYMPELVGKNEVAALITMAQNKLRVGKVTYEKSDKPMGVVISQSIEKDTAVYNFSVVDFVVSGGKAYGETEPDPDETKDTKPKESTKEPETTEPRQTADSTSDNSSSSSTDPNPIGTEDVTTSSDTKEPVPSDITDIEDTKEPNVIDPKDKKPNGDFNV